MRRAILTRVWACGDAAQLPSPTSFGVRSTGKRSDPWEIEAISAESFGDEEEGCGADPHRQQALTDALERARADDSPSSSQGSPAAAEGASERAESESVDESERMWSSHIWPEDTRDGSPEAVALRSREGRQALLRCLRRRHTARPAGSR